MAASIGNAMEWYDFSVYAFFASYIAANFFRDEDTTTALMNTFLVFAVGFVARPLGAVLLGLYGDRKGRKAALTLTIMIMGLGVLIIAVAPTYAVLGSGAAFLLLLGRLLQGFSAGGEIGGAAAFLVEHAPADKRGVYASWLQASMAASNLLSAIVGFAITSLLSKEQIVDWAWRVPFIIGLLIVPVGLYVRRRLPETQTFEEISARVANESRFTPLKLLVTKHLGRLLAGAVFSVLWAVCVYALIIYLPTYYSAPATGLGFTAQHSFLASLVGNVVMVVMCVYAGRLADQFGVQRITTIGTALMLVVPLAALMWLHASKSVTVLLIVHTILCANVALFAGCAPSILPRVYPAGVRSTGMALSYNIAAIFFAGFTPALMTWATTKVSVLAPAYWVMMAAVVCLLVLPLIFRYVHSLADEG